MQRREKSILSGWVRKSFIVEATFELSLERCGEFLQTWEDWGTWKEAVPVQGEHRQRLRGVT